MVRLTSKDLYFSVMFFVVSVFFIFWRLGVPSLADWDEALYAGIATDLTRSGSIANLTLQGTPWFEKEPFPFWLIAASIKMFGANDWAARFPAALISSFIIPLFYLCSRQWLAHRGAFFVSVLFLISPVFWDKHIVRTADFDSIALTFFLCAVVLYFYLRDKNAYWWVCCIPLAAGFLVRGVMGFFPLALIVVFETLRHFFQMPRWPMRRFVVMIMCSLAPWLIWHGYAFFVFGAPYGDVYWKEQFFGRINDPLQGHSGPAFYYALYWYARLKLFFWLMVFGVFVLVNKAMTQKSYQQTLILVWLALFLVPLTIMKTKLYWYGLPVLPALWLAAAYGVQELVSDENLSVVQSPRRGYVLRVLVAVLFFTFVAQAGIWTLGLINGIAGLRPAPIERMVQDITPKVAQGEPIVVYRFGAWNFGRLVPSLYWYTAGVAGWKPLSVDKNNLEHYAGRLSEYPWWLTGDEGLEDLKKILPKGVFEVLWSSPGAFFVHVKGE